MNPMSAALYGTVVVALALSLVAILRADRPGGAWGRRLRSRLLLGVPWGTLVSVLFVLAVYLFLQRGLWHWSNPVTIPYRAWTYLYPTGWLAAGFSHAGPSHLQGNLMGTLVLAPLVEYAWGHLPQDRGARSFGSWRTNPWIRAFVLFPAAVLAVGLVTSLFAWGPVIGFSGVVFAFAGFALVHYPVATVFALLVSSVVQRIAAALFDPIVAVTVSAGAPSPPWWASIAVQGHALGLLIGLVLGLLVLHRRGRGPSAARVWLAATVFVISRGLWAIYWIRGNNEYVLFQGAGVALVLVLALLITTAVAASDRPLVSADGAFLSRFSRRGAGITLLLVALAMVAGPAILFNLVTVGDGAAGGAESVTVEDYAVTYDENVTNRMVSVIDAEAFGESTDVQTSGVIVTSERRHIWFRAVTAQRLSYTGEERIRLGGPGWSEDVVVTRTGWVAAGNDTAYQVWLDPPDGPRRHVFDSEAQTAAPRIDDRQVSVVPEDGEFYLAVERDNESLGRAAVPEVGGVAAAGGLEFSTVRRDGRAVVVAEREGTSVAVAREEQYR